MEFETIKFDLRDDGIGILTLNRPDKLNAMSFQMIEDLHSILDHLMTNLNCRVVILKAAGRAFCAGLDLKESMVLQSKRKPDELKEKFYFIDVPEKDIIKAKMYGQWRTSRLIVKMRRINQPIIAAIQGAASGAGFAFSLAADIRLAGEKAKFNNAFIKVGFSGADLASSYHLPRLIGMSRAAEILYTGRFVEAEEAERIGLVSKVVEGDDEELFRYALEMANHMINKSPLGLRMTKEAINLSMDSPSLETMIQLENRTQMLCSTSADVMEGVKAFFEKRDPDYPLK
ncbi:MAG: enoyl-CoA hydratase/isomerase family protein [Candidatus Lokiarchaeota archaeon]|nr:enoyl-CoA hydratase/isomerase family protein [Candidatus Lokiarchaeota archaeon]MBD3199726.1 enoyl-CoA hydratase/isomerase family protein [Candidatus Lokiarchaeota archaeon]